MWAYRSLLYGLNTTPVSKEQVPRCDAQKPLGEYRSSTVNHDQNVPGRQGVSGPLEPHPTSMGEHMPLHACACLDHAYRVRLIHPKAITCLPRCLPPPHLRCCSAPLVYRGRHCGIPRKGTWVVQRGGSSNGCGEPSICLLPRGGTNGVGPYIL